MMETKWILVWILSVILSYLFGTIVAKNIYHKSVEAITKKYNDQIEFIVAELKKKKFLDVIRRLHREE